MQIDTLYSFDADTGAPLWTRSFQNPSGGVTAVPQSFYGNCLTFGPSLGIVATPVYDRLTHTLYVLASTLEGPSGNQHIVHRLHQIAVLDGSDAQPPAVISGSSTYSDGTMLAFNPDVQPDRPALLESNGTIYVGFGSFDDFYPSVSHGWIFAYSATTLTQVGAFVTERANVGDNYFLGSLWGGGGAIAADTNGNVFFSTGNGHVDGIWNFGDSVVVLSPSLSAAPISFFAPSNNATLFSQDLDLGSGGPLLFPPQPTGKHPNLLWIQGKNNISYLLDRDHLTGISSLTNKGFLASTKTHAFFGTPAFYQDAAGVPWVYSNDAPPGPSARLVQYQIVTSPSYKIVKHATAPIPFLRFSATPVVSSNGTTPGSAIVWYLDRPLTTGTVPLYAFDASNVATELYGASAGSWTINGSGALIQPTVTNGKVYVATDNQIVAFGLLGHRFAVRKRSY